MIGEAKLVLPPLATVGVLTANAISGLPETARVIADLFALAVIFAGFLVVGKLRAEASAAKGAAQAWESERNAAVSRAERLEETIRIQGGEAVQREKALRDEITELRIEMSKLEARPTLESVSSQIDQLRALMTQTAEAVQEVVQSHHRPLPEGGTS